MKIQCSDQKTVELTDNAGTLGHITYDDRFSFKADVIVGNDNYRITTIGIFGTAMSVTKNGTEVARMKMNWKGNIIISFQKGKEFMLKTTGTFRDKYVLEDKDQQKLMFLDANFNCGKFTYNYIILYDKKPQDILLVLLAIYAANYCITAMSSTLY